MVLPCRKERLAYIFTQEGKVCTHAHLVFRDKRNYRKATKSRHVACSWHLHVTIGLEPSRRPTVLTVPALRWAYRARFHPARWEDRCAPLPLFEMQATFFQSYWLEGCLFVVVELGAGCALPSLLASTLPTPPALVVITDYPDEAILANLRINFHANQRLIADGCSVFLAGHEWGSDTTPILYELFTSLMFSLLTTLTCYVPLQKYTKTSLNTSSHGFWSRPALRSASLPQFALRHPLIPPFPPCAYKYCACLHRSRYLYSAARLCKLSTSCDKRGSHTDRRATRGRMAWDNGGLAGREAECKWFGCEESDVSVVGCKMGRKIAFIWGC